MCPPSLLAAHSLSYKALFKFNFLHFLKNNEFQCFNAILDDGGGAYYKDDD
tara:strand:- start:108 stop:260 length:153 start_codon:yes stop_codon:yes gene_type:complete